MAAGMMIKAMCIVLISVMAAEMMATVPRANAAISSCGQVVKAISPCLPYVSSSSPTTSPPPACCSAIDNLNKAASTTADRQTACNCLEQVAKNLPAPTVGKVAGLPGKCSIKLPYPLSPSVDCSKVK